MTSHAQPLPCPNCQAPIDMSRPDCASCGIRLRGPEAVRLWQVDQQLAALGAERRHLVQALLGPATAAAWMPGFEQSAPHPHLPAVVAPARRSAPSGQQLLMGVGALLFLSAATFFVVLVWSAVGVWGQALILALATALAATGAVAATRRRLPAAAETAAVLAVGLTMIGVWAAWSLDLFGLRQVSGGAYAGIAALVAGALALVYDVVVPRTDRAGESLRQIATYQPFAAAAVAASAWFFLAEADPRDVWLPIGFALVALANLVVWFVARRLGASRASVVLPVLGAVVATFLHVVSGLATAHDLYSSTREWSAALLLAESLALAIAAGIGALPRRLNRVAPALVTVVAVPAAWAFTWEAHWALLMAVAVLAALALVGLAEAPLPEGARRSLAHVCTCLALVLVGAGLTAELLVLHFSDAPRLWQAGVGVGPDKLLVAGVAGAWAVATAWVAVRWRSVAWLTLAHFALAATTAFALIDTDAGTQVVAWVAVGVALAGLSAVLVLRPSPNRQMWDVAVAGFAAVFAAIAVLRAFDLPHPWAGWTFVVVGVVAYAWSLLPGRLAAAYAASPVLSVGVGILVSHDAWDVVEAWTWPLALLLAVTGWRHWHQRPDVRSRVSMGPALTVAFLPSAVVAVEEGDTLRLVLVTAAAVLLLVIGLALRLQAPVTVASIVLVLVAITQGGPYIARIDGWVILGAAGLTLLTVGVLWEQAVVAGRRRVAWWSSLR